jgi:hypothetical protein
MAHSPLGLSTSLQGSNTRLIIVGGSRDASFPKKNNRITHCSRVNMSQRNIPLYRPNNLLLHETRSLRCFPKHLLWLPSSSMQKLSTMATRISLLPMRVDTHSSRLIVLISRALITMGCDFSNQPLLHVFSD